MQSKTLIIHMIVIFSLIFFGVGTVAADSYWITIDPVSDSERVIGTPLLVSGLTNLPVGTLLNVEFVPVEYVDVDMVVTKEMVFARTYVQPGNSPSDPNNIWNIWQYEVNTSNFIPPAYQVTVTGLDPEGRQYEAVKPFLISYPVTPTSSQSPGFSGVLSLACALGVFAVFLRQPYVRCDLECPGECTGVQGDSGADRGTELYQDASR